ncbi:MAG: methyltransferase [Actinomycetota bacterium]
MTTLDTPNAPTGDQVPEGPPPPAIALQLAGGFIASQAVYAFAKLGIADALSGGPRPADAVATRVGADPDRLRRLLRSLAGFGVVDEVAPDTYQLTEVGQLFCNEPGSLADMTAMWMETHYEAFAGLPQALTSGRPGFDTVMGEGFWPWIEQRPELAELFSRAMTSMGAQTQSAAVEAFDFTPYQRIVDVGGAHGAFVAAALAQSTSSRGVVFDLPHVVASAAPFLDSTGVADRVECVGGDFFDEVPSAGDLYLLSFILHDWSDADCVRILQSVRNALPDHGRLLILENVIPSGNEPHLGKVLDVVMMTILNGAERTQDEYAALLAETGFEIERVVPTQAPTSLVVARTV